MLYMVSEFLISNLRTVALMEKLKCFFVFIGIQNHCVF